MLKFLINPFFILGVYSNTKIKERTSHITKIKAYSNVGKSTSFPLDFPTCLTPPKRNDKTIEKALSLINTPKECFNSYLFWLSNSNSIDDTAINYAISGNFDKAVEILSKQKKVTSMINLSVMYYLIKQDSKAIEKAFEVINNPDNLSSFIEFFNSSSGHNIDITAEDVSTLYIESLLQYYDINRLYEIFSSLEGDLSEQISYLNVKRATPIIESINQVLSKEKYDRDNKPSFSTLIEKARNITSATDKLRNDLLKTVGEDSDIAQECCSKIASMVRECAIDALSDNLELHEIDKIESIIRNACNISLSDIFKATCEDDFANLNKHRENIEDKELIDAYNYLCNNHSSLYSDIAKKNGDFICYAIPLIEKITIKAGYEIGAKLYDNMVVIIINNIHKVFEQLSYRIRSEIQSVSSQYDLYAKLGTSYDIMEMTGGMNLCLQHLRFLCDMYNRRELFLSRQIAEALFSNQNQLVELKQSNGLYFIQDSYWEYSRKDYVSTYRYEKEQEKQRKIREEEERRRKERERERENQPQSQNRSTSTGTSIQNSSNGGCYIATLVYGDYDHPKVKVLRHFRDNVLLKNNFGKKFVKFYYKYSPGWVQHLKSKKRINRCIRSILNCFVYIYRKIKNV